MEYVLRGMLRPLSRPKRRERADLSVDAKPRRRHQYDMLPYRPPIGKSQQARLRYRFSNRTHGEPDAGFPHWPANASGCGSSANAGMRSRAKRRMFSREPPKLMMTYATPPWRRASSLHMISSGVPKSALSAFSYRASSSCD